MLEQFITHTKAVVFQLKWAWHMHYPETGSVLSKNGTEGQGQNAGLSGLIEFPHKVQAVEFVQEIHLFKHGEQAVPLS